MAESSFGGTLRTLALVVLLGPASSAAPCVQDEATPTEKLTGKAFAFSWQQGTSGGRNGTLVLDEGGRITGIDSPNETSWMLDEEGRLLFLHADGRVSTTFDEHGVRDGKHHFAGPFHFRAGITHFLEETALPSRGEDRGGAGLPGRLLFTSQSIVGLDPGEEYVFPLAAGREVTLRLVSVEEQRDAVVEQVREANVLVTIDGRPHDLLCAPYVMPSVIDGLRIQADTTSGWTELPKRVQFSLWDAADPIVDTTKFGFPLRDYRLFSHGLQCYNEPVHLGRHDGDPEGALFPHSYGIDFAGFEGEEDVLACVAGEVIRLVPDGVVVNIVDATGLIWEYHHLDSIAPHLRPGMRVEKGEKIGVLGRSGPSGNYSHLHVGAFLTPEEMTAGAYTRRLNYYPWMVEAYRAAHDPGPLAVARPHHVALTGETVVFDATHSIPADAPIVAFAWEMPDGTRSEGPRATHTFAAPGAFIATLRIRDAAGREDVDFCRVKVFTDGAPEPLIPAVFMTSTPTLDVRVDEPVRFRMWLHGAEEQPFELDFGDGEVVADYASFDVLEHAFRTAGIHTVTARTTVNCMSIAQKQKVVVAAARPRPASPKPREATSRAAIERDWMLQDYMAVGLPPALEGEKTRWRDEHLHGPEARDDAPVLEHLACFASAQDSVVEERMVARVLDELGPAGADLRHAYDTLRAAGRPGRDPAWKGLYLRACEERRALRLAPLLAQGTRFVFNQYRHIPGSWKYTEGLSDAQAYRFFSPGSSLNLLELVGAYGTVAPLLEDPGGVIRNPDVSFDGTRVLFAWKKSDREDDYHLYEMDVESREIRQLTHGVGVADFEGAYLPDGDIVFSSTRCIQTVDCNWVEVSNLYAMDGDGRFMRRLGFDQVHTIFPTVTDDGRVLYTRWDYNDRAQIYTQPLFQMNGDGTNQREFYGGSSWFPTNLIHARKIPGSTRVVTIVTGHHTPAHGKLGIIDPARGRQEGQGMQLLAPVRAAEPARVDMYGIDGNQFQYPWPLDEERFLVTLALPTPRGQLGRFDIYFIDRDGRRELLVEAPESGEGLGCRQIIPLAPRPPAHIRPRVVDYGESTGAVYVQDVYEGPGLEGIPRGTVKRLRVVGLAYRAAGVGHAAQEGAGGGADVCTPIAVGNGSWDVKVVHGSATVHEDGSAFFRVPARTPLYFQALDEDGFVVQTMRSWTTLMPGETQSCVGCHEPKNSTPRATSASPLAVRGAPEELLPFHGPPRGFSYTKEVQPILDRHCVSCHATDDDPPPCLAGELVPLPDMKRRVSKSYLALTHTRDERGNPDHPLVNWIDSMSGPALLPPRHRGAATSGLMALLKEGHEGVELDAAELETIACWIDLLVPYCGDYLEHNTWSDEERAFYESFAAKRRRQEESERAALRALVEHRRADAPR